MKLISILLAFTGCLFLAGCETPSPTLLSIRTHLDRRYLALGLPRFRLAEAAIRPTGVAHVGQQGATVVAGRRHSGHARGHRRERRSSRQRSHVATYSLRVSPFVEHCGIGHRFFVACQFLCPTHIATYRTGVPMKRLSSSRGDSSAPRCSKLAFRRRNEMRF